MDSRQAVILPDPVKDSWGRPLTIVTRFCDRSLQFAVSILHA